MSSILSKSSSRRQVREYGARSLQTDERTAVNIMRMEIVSMLRLAFHGGGTFGAEYQHILSHMTQKQREAVRKDIVNLANVIDAKIECEDDA